MPSGKKANYPTPQSALPKSCFVGGECRGHEPSDTVNDERSCSCRHEAPKIDSYEAEMAQLARFSPEVVDVQKKSGLSRDDMEASIGQLKLLREKV